MAPPIRPPPSPRAPAGARRVRPGDRPHGPGRARAGAVGGVPPGDLVPHRRPARDRLDRRGDPDPRPVVAARRTTRDRDPPQRRPDRDGHERRAGRVPGGVRWSRSSWACSTARAACPAAATCACWRRAPARWESDGGGRCRRADAGGRCRTQCDASYAGKAYQTADEHPGARSPVPGGPAHRGQRPRGHECAFGEWRGDCASGGRSNDHAEAVRYAFSEYAVHQGAPFGSRGRSAARPGLGAGAGHVGGDVECDAGRLPRYASGISQTASTATAAKSSAR